MDSEQKALAKEIVAKYVSERELVETMLSQLATAVQSSSKLMALVHSLRWRVKDPEHLKDKIARKMLKAKMEGAEFGISVSNVFETINDLAGLRILHLHTTQITAIDVELKKLLAEYKYDVIEDAKARTWDDEYRAFYESVGIATVESPKMYTSVHYVISPNIVTKRTCEIQVRTLAEELWGEVDHSMNYPTETKVTTCRDQIRVLARLTSSCSRLVDSIYSSNPKFK
ncbi:RelA/SpoT domain-containing protein [Luteimonas sp. 50]|uniref:RelA/SpoT domain-containing protein n=1 Tax=Cognatiluteimonas sedimenti TaxID=2927791 RepID=A0ABT0A0J8_9GAMM|nr:RelA/SpoT domain-containing protein [Lysobacter sedimenti]MCJ0824495.1 RelA/SpoT domain-containing protein [Lysobacter sedimenti]